MQKFKSVKKFTCIVIAVMMVLSCVVVGTNAVNTVKVAFTNNKNWGAVNVYTWDANFNNCTGAWPGTPVTSTTVNNYGETVYHAEIPANVTGIVFNDGGSQQTVDIHSFNGQSIGWYMTDQDANNGHWNVETWDYTPEESNTTSPTDTGSYKTIYFTNDKNWNVTAYAWDSANNALLGTWPGTAMTFDYKNTFNQDVFKIFVPAGAVGVVFSNNGGAQTVALVPADNTGYYPDSQEALGKWICKTWAPVHDVPTTVEVTTVEETTIEEPTVEETTVEATTEETNAPIYVDNFSASSYSISLKDSIAINFRVKPETVLGYTDPYLVVTMEGQETVINDYETQADGTIVFSFDKVYPQTVIDDATAVLHAFQGDQEYYGQNYTKSVLNYCVTNQTKVGNPNTLKGLLVNLLKYAGEAQKLTGYKTDNLASDSQYIDRTANRYAKSILTDMVDVKDYHASACPGTVKSEFTAGSLVLGNTVDLKVTFTANDLSDKSVRVDFNGDTKYFSGSDLISTGNGKAYVQYPVYANQFHDTVYFTVCEGADHTPISDTMTYSAASYAGKYIDNATFGPILTAMMLYGQAAETFAAA